MFSLQKQGFFIFHVQIKTNNHSVMADWQLDSNNEINFLSPNW